MEDKKEVGTNTLIIISLVFLFLVFIIIKPINVTGFINLPLIGETSDLSNSILIGVIALLVAIWITVLILYNKLKKKKQLEKIPALPEVLTPVSTIEIPPVQEIQKKEGLTEEELKQLFREIAPQIEPKPQSQPLINKKELELFLAQQKSIEKQPPKPIKPEQPVQQKKPEPTLEENLGELKKLMLALLDRNYTKYSIIKYLQKKGWKPKQIAQVVKEINQTNLKNYIQEVISLGYKKQQFFKQLSSKGWTTQEIDEAMQQ